MNGTVNHETVTEPSARSGLTTVPLGSLMEKLWLPDLIEFEFARRGMGNSNVSTLKAAIISDNIDEVRALLEKRAADTTPVLDELINRKGDTALMLAALLGRTHIVSLFLAAGSDVNHVNKDGNTALDLAVRSSLPPDSDILNRYRIDSMYGYDAYQAEIIDSIEGRTYISSTRVHYLTQIPEVVRLLIDAGGLGRSLQRLIMFAMRDKGLIKYIIESFIDLATPKNFRFSGLLLQVAVWFDQPCNLSLLLDKGIDVRNFWTAPFMPLIAPSNQSFLPIHWNLDNNDADEYCISTEARTSDPIQELKFSFVHEWWADWNEGENPPAQYRAGLQLTPESALLLVRTSNSAEVLERVMEDIMQYLPPTAAGPDLNRSCLFNCFTMAGYVFRPEQRQHLSLKFNVDFTPHLRFNKQPKKLRYLCRIYIRFMFRTNVQLALASLPDLPQTLHDFLLLENDINLT